MCDNTVIFKHSIQYTVRKVTVSIGFMTLQTKLNLA